MHKSTKYMGSRQRSPPESGDIIINLRHEGRTSNITCKTYLPENIRTYHAPDQKRYLSMN